jgi:hypothetical protein
MSWVCLEQLEVLSRKSLHMPWQFVITAPERSKRMGLHGIGLKFPASISASIFSNVPECFPPGEKSCSSSSSQTSLSWPRDECRELGQLFAAQVFHGFLYFRQAHAHTVAAAAPKDNQIAARSRFLPTLPNSYRRAPNAFGRAAGDAASLAHCQNFSAAGLSRPFAPTMPTEIGFGSGVMCKTFTRFPKL